MATPSEATSLNFKDFEIGIEVDGKETPHVGIETNGGKEISCWIASEAEKPFAVKIATTSAPSHGIKLSLLMDGLKIASRRVLPDKMYNFNIHDISASSTERRQFAFGSLETTDDDAYLDSSFPHKTGEIRVELRKATYKATKKIASSSSSTGVSFPVADKVHERSKKGLDHRIKLGAITSTTSANDSVRPGTPYKSYTATHIDKDPMVSFVFKYRPLEILKATGVVPRDRTPTPSVVPASLKRKQSQSEVKHEIISGDEDSEAEEIRLQERLEQIRRERMAKGVSGSRPAKRVKQEPKAYFTPGEVIDLTL